MSEIHQSKLFYKNGSVTKQNLCIAECSEDKVILSGLKNELEKTIDIIESTISKKDFDFVLKAYTKNKNYNIMLVSPLENTNELQDDYTIIYDYKKKIIIEVSTMVSPSTIARVKDKKAIGSKNIYKSIFKTIYRFDDEIYYLVSSKEEIGFERVDKNAMTDIEVRNYFITTNFSNQNYTYKESEVFKDKTLYNKKNVILTNYWDVSGITPTDEEQEIILKIEGKD